MVHAVGMADHIAAGFGAHLLQLDPVPIRILNPGSRPAIGAFWLHPVFIRMPGELSAGSAVAAAGVGFQGATFRPWASMAERSDSRMSRSMLAG